jgi:hypothetical protein
LGIALLLEKFVSFPPCPSKRLVMSSENDLLREVPVSKDLHEVHPEVIRLLLLVGPTLLVHPGSKLAKEV